VTDSLAWQAAVIDEDTGEVVGYVLADIPDQAPDDVREGLARRRIVAVDGTCPCGATLQLPSRAQRRAAARGGHPCPVRVEHEDDCPAADRHLDAALRRWRVAG
jgi:hypothetical protein